MRRTLTGHDDDDDALGFWGARTAKVIGAHLASRSGGRCIVRRAPTGQDGAGWWRERRQVKRALYGEELRRVLT